MTTKPKRNLFDELKQSIEEINEHQQKKLTLRTYRKTKPEKLHIDADFIRKTREALNMSRGVFALKLRVPARTLENWEQGKATPNDQAATLIFMVHKYPDTLARLETL